MKHVTVQYTPAKTEWFRYEKILGMTGHRVPVLDWDQDVLGTARVVAADPKLESTIDVLRGVARTFSLTFEVPDVIADAIVDGQARPTPDWGLLK